MFKRIFLILCLMIQTCAFASFQDILITDIQRDWLDKPYEEKEQIVSEVSEIVFKGAIASNVDLRTNFQDKLKDKNHKNNYYAASAGYTEYRGNNIRAIYKKHVPNIYMYVLQDKMDMSKEFYYNAYGNLQQIDFIFGEYPEYPYYRIQYKISGNPASVIYLASKDCQYVFNSDGKLKGVWFKHNMYNKFNKIISRRTLY